MMVLVTICVPRRMIEFPTLFLDTELIRSSLDGFKIPTSTNMFSFYQKKHTKKGVHLYFGEKYTV